MLNVSGERQGPFSLLISAAFPATPSESLPRARTSFGQITFGQRHSVLGQVLEYTNHWNVPGGGEPGRPSD